MKVLVSTEDGQGIRDNDFNYTFHEELVRFGFDCDGEDVDGRCGCRRSMVGFHSHKATTTFKAIESPLLRQAYVADLAASYRSAGWDLSDEEVEEAAHELIGIACQLPSGVTLERRGDEIQVRKQKHVLRGGNNNE